MGGAAGRFFYARVAALALEFVVPSTPTVNANPSDFDHDAGLCQRPCACAALALSMLAHLKECMP